MPMKLVSPKAHETFTIAPAPQWPSILFKTDSEGPHTWKWKLSWKTFSKSGEETTSGNEWDAKGIVTDCGGTLTVHAAAKAGSAAATVKIVGTNPLAADVTAYVALNPGGRGFEKILAHESKMVHFHASGDPVKSFDNGYGMAQLTSPAPSFEQVWNWKKNVDAGIALFQVKVSTAKTYLSQSGRSYTIDQLEYEAVCRWNGGSYHAWDAKAKAWVRNPAMLCDTATGNIGWDMGDKENAGKTEAQLHTRDKGGYSSAPGSDDHWRYSGVCYADAILG